MKAIISELGDIMNVYTSYYWAYQNGKLPKNIVPIAISRTQPKGLNLPKWTALMPSWDTLNTYKNSAQDMKAEEVYAGDYNKQLKQLDPNELWNQLKKISKGHDVVLLCFENNEKFCHRHLVADWFTNAGYPVKEYGMQERNHNIQEQAEQISMESFFQNNIKNEAVNCKHKISAQNHVHKKDDLDR